MGGALLQPIWNLPSKRIPKVEYLKLGEYLVKKLEEFQPNRRYRVFQSYFNKSDYGDIDIQVESAPGDQLDWIKFFQELSGFKPHKNGKTTSVPINGFQCDFNFIGSENYEISYIYNSYEVGNFCGVICAKSGLKFGHNGLWLKIPLSYFDSELPSHQFKEIQLTKNPEEIFDILGYDYEWFNRGFYDKDELFRWIEAGRHFAPQLFQYEELNHQNRTRNKKRPTYAEFVERCKNMEPRPFVKEEEVRNSLLEKYPHLHVKIEEARVEILLNKERRAKFNGQIIIETFGLQGKELGDFIVSFKKSFTDFENMLDSKSVDEVKSMIALHYAQNFTK